MSDTGVIETVAAASRGALEQLPFDDEQDFEDANRGLIATVDPCVIKADDV